MRNPEKSTRLWTLAALGVAALMAACAAEAVNPQPLPPEDDGTGTENGGKGLPTDNGEQDSPTAASGDAGAAGSQDGGDAGDKSDAAASTDAASEGDGG